VVVNALQITSLERNYRAAPRVLEVTLPRAVWVDGFSLAQRDSSGTRVILVRLTIVEYRELTVLRRCRGWRGWQIRSTHPRMRSKLGLHLTL
jgi:hypothetical protein